MDNLDIKHTEIWHSTHLMWSFLVLFFLFCNKRSNNYHVSNAASSLGILSLWLISITVLSAAIGLTVPEQPYLGPLPMPMGTGAPFQLSPGPTVSARDKLQRCTSLTLPHLCPVAHLGQQSHWSRPWLAGWLPTCTSDLPHHCRHPGDWVLVPDQPSLLPTPMHGLTFWIDFGPASASWTCPDVLCSESTQLPPQPVLLPHRGGVTSSSWWGHVLTDLAAHHSWHPRFPVLSAPWQYPHAETFSFE